MTIENNGRNSARYACYRGDHLCEKGDDEMDPENGCRYWIDCLDCGNCSLRNFKEYTLAEVGRMLGISKERARQLEARGLSKLKVTIGGMRERGETDL